ncbi:MAG: hypothetical protein GY859_15035 [Desulfobacterales bacterium]|nr:hypothetical protein [Desulfobacterales bacterium]
MVRLSRVVVLMCIVVLALTATTWAKPRLAVMDFDNKSQYGGWRVGHGASDMLSTELVKTHKFSMMERDRISAVLKEQNMGAAGLIDPRTAVKIGKLIGVEYIVTGAVTEYGQSQTGGGGGGVRVGKKGYHATVDCRLVNTTTGEIIFADSASHNASSTSVSVFGFGGGQSFNEKKATEVLRGAIKKMCALIAAAPVKSTGKKSGSAKKASKSPLIADVDGKTITVNKGKSAGFKVGQKVNVYRQKKVIKDPSTGKVLKIKYKKVGSIKLTEVESGYAEGQVVSGSGFKVGDEVRK